MRRGYLKDPELERYLLARNAESSGPTAPVTMPVPPAYLPTTTLPGGGQDIRNFDPGYMEESFIGAKPPTTRAMPTTTTTMPPLPQIPDEFPMDDAVKRYRNKKAYEDARKKQDETPNQPSNWEQTWPLPPVDEEREKEEEAAPEEDEKDDKKETIASLLAQLREMNQKQVADVNEAYDGAALFDTLRGASGGMMSIHGEEYEPSGPNRVDIAKLKAGEVSKRQEGERKILENYIKQKQESNDPTKNMLRYMSVDVKDPISGELKKAVFDRKTGKYLSGGEGAFGVIKDRYEQYQDYDPETKKTRTILFDKILGKYFDTDGKPTTPKQEPPKSSTTPKPLTYFDKDTNMYYQDVDGKKVPVKPGPEKRVPGGPKTGVTKPIKTTESEKKSAGYYERAKAANENLEVLLNSGYDPRTNAAVGRKALQSIPLLGHLAKTNQDSEYQQIKDDFITSVIRPESGAAIGDEEYAREERKYFPQPGDGPQTLENKRQSRLRKIEELKASGGFATGTVGVIPRTEAAPQIPKTVRLRRRGQADIKIIPGDAAIKLLQKKDENGQPMYEVAK